MRKLITICVVACLMLVASSVQVNLINGSFEISGLTDWKTVIPSGASTSIVTSHSESVPPGTSTTSWTPIGRAVKSGYIEVLQRTKA